MGLSLRCLGLNGYGMAILTCGSAGAGVPFDLNLQECPLRFQAQRKCTPRADSVTEPDADYKRYQQLPWSRRLPGWA
ncbi:MAG: hypothetical protein ACRD2B_00645 [Terriglobia bacterium]